MSSVAMVGVLLMFSYLIVPSVFAMLFATRTVSRLIICLCVGTFVSVAGFILSFCSIRRTGRISQR